MSETSETLAFFTQGWQHYQNQLSIALAQLEPAQLALVPRPTYVQSMNWRATSSPCGQDGSIISWKKAMRISLLLAWAEPGSLPRSARELVSGLGKTWQVMQEVLGRYTLSDLRSTVQDEWKGQIYTLTRGWVIWHVMEHDIHHGGEIAYSLGMHGLAALEDGGKRDIATQPSTAHPLIVQGEE